MPDTTCKVIPVPLGITHRGLNGDSKQIRNIYEAPPACRVLPRPCRDGEVTRGPRPLKGLALFREGGQARNTPPPPRDTHRFNVITHHRIRFSNQQTNDTTVTHTQATAVSAASHLCALSPPVTGTPTLRLLSFRSHKNTGGISGQRTFDSRGRVHVFVQLVLNQRGSLWLRENGDTSRRSHRISAAPNTQHRKASAGGTDRRLGPDATGRLCWGGGNAGMEWFKPRFKAKPPDAGAEASMTGCGHPLAE